MRLPFLLALLLSALPARATPPAYALDPVHTRVLVAASHAGFSQALGTVSGASGTLHFDPGDWATATLEVSVPLARLDFGDARWNRAVARLLDVDRHPEARFSSTRVEPVDAARARVFGTLQLHGTSREVVLDVVLNALRRHPLPPFRRTAGFSATATLSRTAFGIDAWPNVIGDEVQLRIEVEAVRSRAGASPSTPDAGEAAADAEEVADEPEEHR